MIPPTRDRQRATGNRPTSNVRIRTPAYKVQRVTEEVLITVRVIPRAGRSEIAGTRGDAVLVRLKAAPVDGAANAELIEVVADALGVPKRAVTIASGATSRRKTLRVSGLSSDAVLSRLRGS